MWCDKSTRPSPRDLFRAFLGHTKRLSELEIETQMEMQIEIQISLESKRESALRAVNTEALLALGPKSDLGKPTSFNILASAPVELLDLAEVIDGALTNKYRRNSFYR